MCGAIEAVLFMSDRPIGVAKIKNLLGRDIPLHVLHGAIERLQGEYDRGHHGIDLREVAQGYQFRTKETYAKFVRDLFKANSLVLSSSALEVLAIIAYKCPVPKTEIERIRGVDSSHIVRGLIEKKLVRVIGKSEGPGRPTLYATTKEFLETFNLASLSDLPPRHELEEMASEDIGSTSEIVKLATERRKEMMYHGGEIEEGDILEKTIKSVPSSTPFTRRLAALAKKKKDRDQSGEELSALDVLEEYVGKKEEDAPNSKNGKQQETTHVFDQSEDKRSAEDTLTSE